MSSSVAVSIVTYNSALHLKTCLQSLQKQSFSDFGIYIIDNASSDATAGIIEEFRHMMESVHYSERNLGFCAAHNRIIESVTAAYVLVLNPDVVLDSRFLEIMAREMDRDPRAGSATGKLYRWNRPSFNEDIPPSISERMELDSTGIFFTRNQRHLDRGSGETDSGQYNRKEYVFGASGAAALYRCSMLEDIRNGEEYFDESFFAYREDADLSWRARWMGWECLYVPEAIAFHERQVLPERRSSLPDAINMHSFKNRFLLRIRNMDVGTYARNIIPITIRDIAAIGYVLFREWSSLPGISLLIRSFPKALAAHRTLKEKRRISPKEIRKWFTGMQSKPLPEK
ncbi:MAG: glycosyltransferase [Acidobacteria bacterium]|nr:glycosyltransferase [Acidobacteriota bacterium]